MNESPELLIDAVKSPRKRNGKLHAAKPVAEPAPAAPPSDAGQGLYLLGRPELSDFLRHVRNHAVDPPGEGELVAEWEAARKVIEVLEKEEAGIADDPVIEGLQLHGPYEKQLIEFVKDPLVQNSFNTVPSEVAMVDLERMAVYQKHIDLSHVEQLKKKLGPSPSAEEVFLTCLPYHHPQPPVKWSRMHSDTYVFVSPSNDIRFLGTMPLNAGNIVDYPPPGSLVSVLGLAVGFGTNFMNALHVGNRLILNNGSHRAYALRDLGITRVPCIVQHVSTMDQMDIVGATEIYEDQELFVKGPRPPMLKDYFDPRLRKVMATVRLLKQIVVKFDIEEGNIPAF